MKYIYIFVLFLILSSPFMYNLTNKILKNIIKITYKNNRPTFYGLIVHTFIFLLFVRLILQFNNLKEKLTSYEMLKREELYEGDDIHNHDVNINDLQNLYTQYEDLFDKEIDPDNHSLLQSDHFIDFLNNDNNRIKNLKKIITNPNFAKVIDKIKNDGQKSMKQAVLNFEKLPL